jgi:hypothetical protein
VNTKHTNAAKADKQLEGQLRKRIAEKGLYNVAKEMQIGTDAIRSYLAGLPMRPSTFRGIEATIAGGHLLEAQTANGASRR